ncbi:MAG: hypothetical protein LBU38_07215 [Propionibacteriaceae bacterium]|jgi:hypothetical protein|nr:hypothetical protein [Propionibacteriaceae bacterium]
MTIFMLVYPVIPVWRDRHTLQIGIQGYLTLEDVPKELADAITLLNRPTSRDGLAAKLPQLSEAWLDYLLAQLTEHQLLREVQTSRLSVAVFGSSFLSGRITRAINITGVAYAHSIGLGSEATLLPSKHLRPRGSFDPWPQLTILATSTVEPDRTLTDELSRSGRDHLIVRLTPGAAKIGPLVIAGKTSCLRCQDLAFSRQDEAWPRILAQLSHISSTSLPFLQDWAISTICAQVIAYRHGFPPDTMFRSLELDAWECAVHATTIPIHPECKYHQA